MLALSAITPDVLASLVPEATLTESASNHLPRAPWALDRTGIHRCSQHRAPRGSCEERAPATDRARRIAQRARSLREVHAVDERRRAHRSRAHTAREQSSLLRLRELASRLRARLHVLQDGDDGTRAQSARMGIHRTDSRRARWHRERPHPGPRSWRRLPRHG